jgi:hypothetical protein
MGEFMARIDRAVARRNFVRATALAYELNLDGQRIRSLQHNALRQFLSAYQNFDGATRLCTEHSITANELAVLIAELLKQKELESKTNYSFEAGQPTYLSIATQIRLFAQRQIISLREHEARRKVKGWWRRLTSTLRSWFDRLSDPWRGGEFPRSGMDGLVMIIAN